MGSLMALKATISRTAVSTQDGTVHKLVVEGAYLVIHNGSSNPPFFISVDYSDASDWDSNVFPAIKAELEAYSLSTYGTTLFTAAIDTVSHNHRIEVQ